MKPFQRQTFERNMFQSNCTSADRCANYNCLRKLVPPAKRGCFIVFQHANSECERKDNGRRYFFRVNPIDKNLLFYLRAATWAMRPAAQQRPVTFSVWKVQSYPLTCQVHVFLLISTATNFLPKAAVWPSGIDTFWMGSHTVRKIGVNEYMRFTRVKEDKTAVVLESQQAQGWQIGVLAATENSRTDVRPTMVSGFFLNALEGHVTTSEPCRIDQKMRITKVGKARRWPRKDNVVLSS